MCTLLVALSAFAQPAQPPAVKYPRLSQKSSLMQTIGTTDMTIVYSRPGVKGRAIWGALVPYDKVWRTGANEATTVIFDKDIMIGGAAVPAGAEIATLLPSVSRTKPVVTTRSGGSTPLSTTAWISSCWVTVTGRIETVLSSLTT